jgi:hypothetical protein
MIEMEKNFTETLGTRVRIEKGKTGGKVTIDFFSPEDLRSLLEKLVKGESAKVGNVAGDNSAVIPAERWRRILRRL